MLHIKNKFKFLLSITGILITGLAMATQPKYPTVTIGILVPMQHHAMDEIVAGFKDTLKKSYSGKINFLIKNAQGDTNLQRSILQEFARQDVDVYAPIATQPTQMTMAMVRAKPIVGIAAEYTEQERLRRKFANITVVDDEITVATQLQFIQKVITNLRQITLVHSPSDKIMPEVAACIRYAKAHNIKVQNLMVQQLAELYAVGNRVSRNSQAIFIFKDSLIASGIRTLVKQANKLQIPLITSDDGTVQNGAAFALGVREYQIGAEGAKLVAQILQGKSVKKIPIKKMDHYFVFINSKAITQQGLQLKNITQAAKELHYKICNVGRGL